MRTLILRTLVFLVLCVAGLTIAQQIPSLPGFPSNGSNGGSGGDTFWFDAGTVDSTSPSVAKGMNTVWRIGTPDGGVGVVFDAPTGTGSATVEQGIAIGVTGGNPNGTASYGAIGFYQFGFSSKGGVLSQLYSTNGTCGASRSGFNIQSTNSINFAGSSGGAGNWGCGASIDYGSFSPVTQGLLLRAPSGFDAIQFLNNGARLHLTNGGTNDYFTSNGSRIQTPANLEWTNTSATQIYGSGNGTFGLFNAGITSGTASAATPAFAMYSANALDTGDALLEVSESALRHYAFTVYTGSPVKAWYGIEIGSIAGGAPDGGAGADPIFKSYRATYTPDGGTVALSSCQANSVAKTGAAAGDECAVGFTVEQTDPNQHVRCFVTTADIITFQICNTSGSSITPSGVFSCRCFGETP